MSATVLALDELVARLPNLDRGTLLALAAAHDGPDPDRERAWDDARVVVRRERMEQDLDRLRDDVGRWATRLGAVTGQEAGSGMTELLLADVRRGAAPAVLDAATALLLGDRLTEADREALLRPWRQVVGP
jgi:hypothetical protein